MKAVFVGALLLAASPRTTDDSWSWAQATHEQAWSAMSDRLSPVADEQDGVEWSADVVVDDGWGRAGIVRVWQPFKGPARVEFVMVTAANLLGALHQLREADPAITAETAIARLPLAGGCASGCPDVRKLVERFRRLSTPVMPPSYLALHSAGFEVIVRPSYRSERRYEVDEGENPLASWCAEMVKALRSCRLPPKARCG